MTDDLVGRAFRLLAEGLAPIVARRMAAVDGPDWLRQLHERDQARHGTRQRPSATDPAVLLRLIATRADAFGVLLVMLAPYRAFAGVGEGAAQGV